MANYRIKGSELIEQPGQPDIFFNEDDFAQVLNNPEDRAVLEEQCGHSVSVGPLGVLNNNNYVDEEINVTLPEDTKRKGALGYHANLQ